MTCEVLYQAPIKSAGFFLGGKAVFTIAVPGEFVAERGGDLKDHYTYKILHREANNGWPECYMAFLLCGPDNTSDYRYMGKLDLSTMQLKLSAKSVCGPSAWSKLILERVLACAAADQLDKIEAAGWALMHEGRCCVCGRRLTVPSSIEAGIGPECASK